MSSKPNQSMPPPSILQQRFSLAELIDLDAFRDVCQSYADLFQISFKLFNSTGELLIDVKGNAGDFCSYAFQFPEGKARCMREVSAIRRADLTTGETISHDCFSGLRYLIAPIQHEAEELGRVVYGPFWPQTAQMPDLSDLGEKYNPEIAQGLMGRLPRVRQSVALDVVKHLVGVIEVMLYTGYKQLLTSRMHVEAVSTGYNELQQKNDQLRKSYERLKELDRLKSSFLATVSHELRTPLTSVIGYSEMLIEGLAGELNEEQRDYVKTIMDKGENLLSLIASILDFSKVESGSLRLDREQTDVRAVIDAAISTLVPLARKRELQLSVAATEDVPPLLIDGGKLRQALINILSNAVKFNQKGGSIQVATRRIKRPRQDCGDDCIPAALAPPDEELVEIAISDSGIGIPEAKLERVFDSFYQVDGSSTREYGGIGLGLAISNSYIQAHGGRIEVQSKAGQGSTFSIVLPLDLSTQKGGLPT